MQQPAIDRSELAEYLVQVQPASIRDILLEDKVFREKLGLKVNRAIVYQNGPEIPKLLMYKTARLVLADGQPRKFQAIRGEIIDVFYANDQITVSFKINSGEEIRVCPTNLLLLSPNADLRSKAFDRIAVEYGPTGPDATYWKSILAQKALDDDEMEQFSDQTTATAATCFGRIQKDIISGVIDRTNLVPRSIEYWQKLCGKCSPDLKQEDWVRNILRPHQQQLINRDLARGLEICLAMNLNDELMPRDLVTNISDDDLWNALQSILPSDNPMSLIGIVDLAVSRAHLDKKFYELAKNTIRRLCSEKLERAGGINVYDFHQAIVDFMTNELQTLPEIVQQPSYWRRICAWTQAGLFIEAVSQFSFVPQDIVQDFANMQSSLSTIAELIDLQDDPLWSPMNTSGIMVRAEIIARLKSLLDKEEALGNKMSGADELKQAVAELAQSAPMMMYMPGPLEIHNRPKLQLSELNLEQQTEVLGLIQELTADIENRRWLNVVYLSRLMRFGEESLSRLINLVHETVFGSTAGERRKTIHHFSQVCLIAVQQKYFALAEAILTRCLREIGDTTNQFEASAYMRMGLIAVAALEDLSERRERLAGYLLKLSHLLPPGEASAALHVHIEDLKRLTPATEWWRYSRSEALAMLSSA